MPASNRGRARRSRKAKSGMESNDFSTKKEDTKACDPPAPMSPPPPQVEDVNAEAVLKEMDNEEVVQPPPPPEPPSGEDGDARGDGSDDKHVPGDSDISDDIKRLYGLSSGSDGSDDKSPVVDVDAEEVVESEEEADGDGDAGGLPGGDEATVDAADVLNTSDSGSGSAVRADVSSESDAVHGDGSGSAHRADDGGDAGADNVGNQSAVDGGGDAAKKPRGKRHRRTWPPEDPAERDAWFDKDLKALGKKAADLGKVVVLMDVEEAAVMQGEELPATEQMVHAIADLEAIARNMRTLMKDMAAAPEDACYTLDDLRAMSLPELAALIGGE